jgi:hypothetical protein
MYFSALKNKIISKLLYYRCFFFSLFLSPFFFSKKVRHYKPVFVISKTWFSNTLKRRSPLLLLLF